MIKFKPITLLIPENTNDIFVDINHLHEWIKESLVNKIYYEHLKLGFGKNLFIFDVNSCEFFQEDNK